MLGRGARRRAPQLSIWIRCHRDAAIVARVVDRVRPCAGEVLVAADARMSREEVALLARARPDRIVRVPPSFPPERATAWIQSQCRGRWALRLDGDEVPSRALLEALPELTASDHLSAYQIPQTWLWGSPDRRLDQRPWWPDHHARLTRNDPALTHIPGRLHTAAESVGQQLFIEVPIHHLVLLLLSREERERKVAGYASDERGREQTRRSFNANYYLPESASGALPATAIAGEDARFIADALRTRTRTVTRFRMPPATPAAEIDKTWQARPWGPATRHAAVVVRRPPASLRSAEPFALDVGVEHTGSAPWPGGWPDGPHVAAIWTGRGGAPGAPVAVPLPGPLGPGDTTDVRVALAAPGVQGQWTLDVILRDPAGHEVARAASLDVRVG